MRRLLLLGLVIVALPGCPLFISPYVTVEPEVNLKGKTLLVIPFSDAENTYFASRDGEALASMVIQEVRRGAKRARVVDPDEVQRLFPGQDPEAVGWQRVGQAVGADYVLVGHIDTLTVRDPKDPNLYMGTLAVRLKVVDTVDGSLVYSVVPPESRYRWSASGHPDIGMSDFDISEEQVRANTLALGTRRIGDIFCPRKIPRGEYQRRQRNRVRMIAP